jgi:ferrous iron transport protein B
MPLVTTPTVALVGNPNTGKTTLFNALSGMRQQVGNYPGVTVETKKGKFRHKEQVFSLIDLPGTYSLAPRSPDEMVAVDVILGHQKGEARPDVVVSIVDGSNLERNLYLTSQVLELGVPVVIALNMIDVAQSQGITIDVEKLSQQMGVPIVPIQANKGRGLEELRQVISDALDRDGPSKMPRFPEALEQEVELLREVVGNGESPFLLRRLLFDTGGQAEKRLAGQLGHSLTAHLTQARQRLAEAKCPVPAVEARSRYGWIREVTAGCVRKPKQRRTTWTDRLDHVLTHRVWGTLMFLALMFLVFQSIFVWAGPLMDLIDGGKEALANLVGSNMAAGPLRSLIVSGVIEGVGGIIIFLPQIVILFGFIAILEDCGYMARAAFLMDKLMARCGLSGKSFIPMLSSVACAVPGIMGARVIENPRDRLATILVAPLMSCSARLPVYVLFIAAFLSPEQGFPVWLPGVTLFAMYMIGLIVAPLVAWVLKSTLIRGETPVFVMEMPTYKMPSVRTVARRMTDSGWMFVRRAGTLILASMILIWALLYFPSQDENGESYDVRIAQLEESDAEESNEQINQLDQEWKTRSYLGQAGRAIEPAVRPLGWDWRIGMAALASFPAREVFVGTMGIIYRQGEGDADDEDEFQASLAEKLQNERWDDEPERKVFTVPVALSIMVFFALCCQCVSTLAVIRRESNSWFWPVFTFVYMTGLAYVGALLTYQIGMLFI